MAKRIVRDGTADGDDDLRLAPPGGATVRLDDAERGAASAGDLIP